MYLLMHMGMKFEKNSYGVLVSNPEGKRWFRCSWENNIKIDWTDLAYGREKWRAVENAILNLKVRQNVGNTLLARN